MKIVSYIRCSTDKQQRSGLGLEAQQAEIQAFATTNAATIIAKYVEVESGRKNDREKLTTALRHARVHGAKLVIAKLDRLGRNAAFLMALRDSGADFVACDDPHTTPLTAGIKAIIAEEEARQISSRTIAALQACKARGVRLGNPNGAAALHRAGKGNKASCEAQRGKANAFAEDLSDTLADVQAAGHMTLKAQASELNKRGIKTARGGRWHASSVSNLHKRLEAVA